MPSKTTQDEKLPDYQAIGEMLKDTRESYEITAEQAAQDLRLKVAYIHALERGDLDAIPGMTYAKGYLRAYAQYLGINLNTMLSLLTSEAELKPMASLDTGKSEPMRIQMAVTASLVMLLIGAGLFYFWQQQQHDNPLQRIKPVPEEMAHFIAERPLMRQDIETALAKACAKAEDALYPPCYKEVETWLQDAAPPASHAHSAQLRSVMEVAQRPRPAPLLW